MTLTDLQDYICPSCGATFEIFDDPLIIGALTHESDCAGGGAL